MPKDSKYPRLNQEIPQDIINAWQKTVNLMTELLNVPAGLIMHAHPQTIEVFIKSNNEENVYKRCETANLNTGLYCERVMDTKSTLIVPDALKDPIWENNPDVPLGMISYMGMPILWPEGEVFGTICVLDSKHNAYSKKEELLLEQFRVVIESSLNLIYKQEKLNIERQLRHESEKKLMLQSKIVSLNELITNISHQWRQPLSGIAAASANIAIKIELGEKINNEDIIKFSDFVTRESQYLSCIIDDFSKTFDNVKEIHYLSLKSIFYEVQKELKYLFEDNNVNYINNSKEDAFIYANERVLINIFSSIYNNSVESMVLNDVPQEDRYFFINLKKDESKIVISFKDSGGGMKQAIIDRIFEPYFSTKFKARGIGISLYIVYQVITNHLNGSIKIRNIGYQYKNRKLKGAEVVIELPVEKSYNSN